MTPMGFTTITKKKKKINKHKTKRPQRRGRNKDEEEDEIVQRDERFQAAFNRPQFSKPKEHEAKVVLDDRFVSVLTDPRFQLQERDRYGRKRKQERSEELGAFYRIETNEEDNDVVHDDDRSGEDSSSENSESPDDGNERDDDSAEDPASRIKYLTALSRGELSVSSSSSSEDEGDEKDGSDSSDDEEPVDAIYGTAGVLDPSTKQDEEVSLTHEPSPYIAVMDMDWKHVRAVDLFAILASFAPPGSVRRVQVFPSNFGLERMAKEAQHGPTDLWKRSRSNDDDDEESEIGRDDDDDDDQVSGSESEADSTDERERYLKQLRIESEEKESDFDTEKLRAYEVSKLKYYFAVVEFALPEHADVAYQEVDGLELEHSSAAMDLRSIPPDELEDVVKDRKLRDEAISIPSNYQPPDFVVNALQQSNVQCTWEDGDEERHRKLTGYGTGDPGSWGAAAEDDDLHAYLASDASSSDEDESGENGGKASKLRKILLGDEASDGDEESDADRRESSDDDMASDNDFSMQATFIPGQIKLEDRIRSRLEAKKERELTPWEKYKEKRKEKRRERRQARRKLRKGIKELGDGDTGSDPEFGKASFGSDNEDSVDGGSVGGGDGDGDDFFLEASTGKSTGANDVARKNGPDEARTQDTRDVRVPSSKEELELLLAGDNDEEDTKDYDMRGLQRIEKNKNRKLRGSRKRKENELATAVSGKDFRIDTNDPRFAAFLDGSDDRFGIDRTDPNYKETEAMKEILAEQTKRRKRAKKQRNGRQEEVAPNVSAGASDGVETSGGAAALSSLVMSLKTKVARNNLQ